MIFSKDPLFLNCLNGKNTEELDMFAQETSIHFNAKIDELKNNILNEGLSFMEDIQNLS